MTRSELRKHQQQIRENLRRPVRVLCSGLGNQLVRSDEERLALIAEVDFGGPENADPSK